MQCVTYAWFSPTRPSWLTLSVRRDVRDYVPSQCNFFKASKTSSYSRLESWVALAWSLKNREFSGLDSWIIHVWQVVDSWIVFAGALKTGRCSGPQFPFFFFTLQAYLSGISASICIGWEISVSRMQDFFFNFWPCVTSDYNFDWADYHYKVSCEVSQGKRYNSPDENIYTCQKPCTLMTQLYNYKGE